MPQAHFNIHNILVVCLLINTYFSAFGTKCQKSFQRIKTKCHKNHTAFLFNNQNASIKGDVCLYIYLLLSPQRQLHMDQNERQCVIAKFPKAYDEFLNWPHFAISAMLTMQFLQHDGYHFSMVIQRRPNTHLQLFQPNGIKNKKK